MESVPSPTIELRPDRPSAEIRRGGAIALLAFDAPHRGESLLFVTVSAPAVDWGRPGAECAVVTVSVDGSRASDLLVLSERAVTRGVALGRLEPGVHDVSFGLSGSSPPGATAVFLDTPFVVHAAEGSDDEVVLRHAPVLVGRSLPEFGGPLQNTVTDTPLLAWHRLRPGSDGGGVLEYSVLWSHEDGGTDGPALMARWGGTTDIEWIYRVAVDGRGDRIPGSAVFQGRGHETRPFDGAFEADHPLLQTCTDNNMVSDRVADAEMRFFLAADETLDAGRARESVMERQSWIYAAMTGELSREGRLHRWNGPEDPSLGDARGYLYLEFDARPAHDGPAESRFAIGVRLAGDRQLYRSDHGLEELALSARGPQSTAVRLPPGSRAEDVLEVSLLRVGGVGRVSDVVVLDVMRMFLLDVTCQPRRIKMRFPVPIRLSPLRRKAILWSRVSDPTSDLSRYADPV